jgi:hypothetical protein
VSPAAGTVFSVPADVTVQAEVADSDDAVAKVQFYRDGRLWAVLTNAPYALVWTNVPPGRHTVSARATDVFGLSATASAQFTVTNAAPSVRLTAPAAGSNFPRRADITLEAAASDSDGGIARVSFYANGRLLGATTNAPYSLVWRSVAPGVYSLRAHATDRYGLKTESEPVLISVSR